MAETGTSGVGSVLWRLELFGGPHLCDAQGNTVRRFRSQRVAALLGYLGLHLGKDCSRELMWPRKLKAMFWAFRGYTSEELLLPYD